MMMYTAVSERLSGTRLPNWMANVSQYDAYCGHFGSRASPITYYTEVEELPFSVIVFSEVRLTGWFEEHDKNLIQPALLAITALQS